MGPRHVHWGLVSDFHTAKYAVSGAGSAGTPAVRNTLNRRITASVCGGERLSQTRAECTLECTRLKRVVRVVASASIVARAAVTQSGTARRVRVGSGGDHFGALSVP